MPAVSNPQIAKLRKSGVSHLKAKNAAQQRRQRVRELDSRQPVHRFGLLPVKIPTTTHMTGGACHQGKHSPIGVASRLLLPVEQLSEGSQQHGIALPDQQLITMNREQR
jgi:hypothetical protein